MGELGKKLRTFEGGRIAFWCPGCNSLHILNTGWSFNGNLEKPTFNPSVLVRTGHYVGGENPGDCYCDLAERVPEAVCDPPFKCTRCHSFVRDGNIQFLSDSTHALAGQTVPLPDFLTDLLKE